MLLAVALIYLPLAFFAGRALSFNPIVSIIVNLGLLAGAAFGALVSLRIIPTKAKKSLPAAIVFAITAVLVVVTLVMAIINSGIFAPNTENDGHKRSDPCEIYDGTANRTYHPCLEEGNEIWFEYKASSSEERRFYLGSIESEYTISIYKGKSKDAISTATNDELVVEVESGKTYLILVTLSTDSYVDCNWSISVGDPVPAGASASKASPLTVGDTGIKEYSFLSSYEYSDVWFKFTPTESGKYIFEVYESSSTPNIYIYTDPDGYYLESNWNGKMEYVLTADTTYYYKVSPSGSYYGYSFGVKLNPEPKGTSDGSAYVLTEDGFSYTEYESLENGTDVWFKFVPTTSSYYKFIPDEGNLYYYVYSKSSYGYLSSMSSTSGYYSMDAGSEYYVKVYSVYDDGFDMQVEHVLGTSFDNAIELSDTDSTEAASLRYLHTYAIYFKFTPDVSGYYSFDTDYSYSHDLYLYSENNTSTYLTSASNTELKYYLEADTTYYLKLSYSYNYCDDSFTVSVDSIAAGSDRQAAYDIFEGKNEAQEYASLVDGTEVWFKFTPEYTGYYQFALTGASTDYSCYVYWGSRTYYETSYGVYYYLSSGSTYYIYYYDVTDDDSFGIKAEKAKGDSMYNAIELEDGVECFTGYNSSIHSYSEMYFEFTPENSGWYVFNLLNTNSTYLYLYNSFGTQITYVSDSALKYDLSAGSTYYLKVYFSYSTDSDYSIIARPMYSGEGRETAYELNEGNNAAQEYESLGVCTDVWFKFTPEYTGYYQFALTGASGDYSCYVYYGSNTSYESSYGIYYYLYSGSTYYIYYCDVTDDSFGIKAEKAKGDSKDNAIELEDGVERLTGCNSYVHSDSTMYFQFTPKTSGIYTIALSNANYYDLYYYYSDYSGWYIVSENAAFYCELEANVTYYFAVRFNSPDDSYGMIARPTANGEILENAYTLVEGKNEAQEYESLKVCTDVWFKFTPENNGYYQFALTGASANHSCYICYESGTELYSPTQSGIYYYLYTDTTYYIYYYDVTDDSFGITVETAKGTSMDNAIELEEDEWRRTGYGDYIHSSSQMYFEFTPEEDGVYAFSHNADYSVYIYLYDASGYQLTYNSYSTYLEYSLTAGSTYYYQIYFVYSSGRDSDYNVKVSKVHYGASIEDAITIGSSGINTGYNSSYNTDNEIWYTFTTSDAGQYTLYLDYIYEYHDVYVYDDIEATNLVANETGCYGSEWLYFDCEADTTYYVKVYFTGYWTDNSFYISAYKN